jgi:hypothetical protein
MTGEIGLQIFFLNIHAADFYEIFISKNLR